MAEFNDERYQQEIGWMIEYFKKFSAENPDAPHWSHGLHVAEKWHHLLHAQSLAQEQIDQLVEEIYTEGCSVGSVWANMATRFQCWAEDKGFVVSHNIPPSFEEFDEITLHTQLLNSAGPTAEA